MRSAFIQLLLVVILVGQTKGGSSSDCQGEEWCYCKLTPDSCTILVSAEIKDFTDQKATIEILGQPHHDPRGVVNEGQMLDELRYSLSDLVVGDVGLLLIVLPEPCYGNDAKGIVYALTESKGKYPCEYDPEFPGAELVDVVKAVLSPDCAAAVEDLGVRLDNS